MNTASLNSASAIDDRAWLKILSGYRQPHRGRSAFELAITVIPLAVLWALSYAAVHYGFWWGLLLTIPAAGFLLRLFMIQHDCGHGAFFAHRHADDWTGRVLGVLTLTPYDYWRRAHATHHASAGNLDERGVGDITTLTVAEYRAMSRWGRLQYRLYRNPIVMFGIGPAWLFVFKHRLPFGMMQSGAQPWISTMATNLGIAILVTGLIWLTGLGTFLLVHLPIVVLASTAGVWLFYVQHQFEHTHWESDGRWSFHEAALHGSSHLELPAVLRWFTANIGVHHVHHLVSRVPFYRLSEVLRDHPQLAQANRLTIADSWRTFRLALWDAEERRMVSFAAVRSAAARP